jgi:hypothetical protein
MMTTRGPKDRVTPPALRHFAQHQRVPWHHAGLGPCREPDSGELRIAHEPRNHALPNTLHTKL